MKKLLMSAAAALVISTSAFAQTRIVVPFAPGGTTDLTARVVAEGLSTVTGSRVVVENRPGGNLQVALAYVARQPVEDTIFIGNSGMLAFNYYSADNAGESVDPLRALRVATLAVESPMVMMVSPSMPSDGLATLRRMRTEGQTLNYGVVGRGSSLQMASDLFTRVAGVSMTSVQYSGAAPAMLDLTAGRISMIFDSVVVGMQNHDAGRARAIAVTSAARSRNAPGIPTMREIGVDLDFTVWQGLFVRADASDEMVETLNQRLTAALRLPEVRDKLLSMGFDTVLATSVSESRTRIDADACSISRAFR